MYSVPLPPFLSSHEVELSVGFSVCNSQAVAPRSSALQSAPGLSPRGPLSQGPGTSLRAQRFVHCSTMLVVEPDVLSGKPGLSRAPVLEGLRPEITTCGHPRDAFSCMWPRCTFHPINVRRGVELWLSGRSRWLTEAFGGLIFILDLANS